MQVSLANGTTAFSAVVNIPHAERHGMHSYVRLYMSTTNAAVSACESFAAWQDCPPPANSPARALRVDCAHKSARENASIGVWQPLWLSGALQASMAHLLFRLQRPSVGSARWRSASQNQLQDRHNTVMCACGFFRLTAALLCVAHPVGGSLCVRGACVWGRVPGSDRDAGAGREGERLRQSLWQAVRSQGAGLMFACEVYQRTPRGFKP